MRDINIFLPFGEGFSVVTIKPDGDALQIDLIPHATRFPSCSSCQKPCSTTHEYCERTVRDLPILGRAVRLSVLLRPVGCHDFGKRMEAVSWLDRYSRVPGLTKVPAVELPQEWLPGCVTEGPASRVSGTFRLLAHCTEKTNVPASSNQWVEVFRRMNLELIIETTGCFGMSGTYGHESRN